MREITEKVLARGNTAVTAPDAAVSDPHPSLGAVASGDAELPP